MGRTVICDTYNGANKTLTGTDAPAFAAVVFNFGLHDTNDSGEHEESRDEFVPLADYGKNLVAFAGKIRQMQPKAVVGWLSSTPMHFNMHLNGNVIAYNKLAFEKLVAGKVVDANLDLYAAIVAQCGTPPYFGSKAAPHAAHKCALISDNEEYHYNGLGWKFLAKQVEGLLRSMLKQQQPPPPPPRVTSTAKVGTTCEDGKTFCPAGSTCIKDGFSDTKWGCCALHPVPAHLVSHL